MAQMLRPFTGGQFMLELDGSPVGFVTSVDGGHFKADEVKYQTGVGEYLNLVTNIRASPSTRTSPSPSAWPALRCSGSG